MNIASIVFDRCLASPDKPAMLFEDRVWTYADLHDQTCRTAAVLQTFGVRVGDRVALLLPNIPEFAVTYLATQMLGAIAVSLNVMLKRNELGYILDDCRPKLVITTRELAQNLPEAGGQCYVLVVDDPSGFPTPIDAAMRVTTITAMQAHDPAAIVYTSGTTGFPKGAVLSHGNLIFNAQSKQRYCTITEDDRLLLFVPLFHCFGQNAILISGFYAGATIVLHRRFNLAAILDSIQRDQVTMFFGVPTIFVTMLQAGISQEQLTSIRYYFSAASILPEAISRQWNETYGKIIHEGYGLTETSPFSAYNHHHLYKFGSIGVPIAEVSMKIVDSLMRDVAPQEKGEILIKGPNVMLGYWNELSTTSSAFHNGWFRSGDVGIMDEDGYFYIVDRIKDMINVSGFKVYPSDVERVLRTYPAVKDVAVYGVPNELSTEVVYADIIIHPDHPTTVEQIRAFCREQLATYKIPATINLVPTIPRNPTGKILKNILRERALGHD